MDPHSVGPRFNPRSGWVGTIPLVFSQVQERIRDLLVINVVCNINPNIFFGSIEDKRKH